MHHSIYSYRNGLVILRRVNVVSECSMLTVRTSVLDQGEGTDSRGRSRS